MKNIHNIIFILTLFLCNIAYSLPMGTYYGTVSRVIDGDTIVVVDSETEDNYNLRLFGVDTPELRAKNKKKKELAIFAKQYLEKLLPIGQNITFEVVGPASYRDASVIVWEGKKEETKTKKGNFKASSINEKLVTKCKCADAIDDPTFKWHRKSLKKPIAAFLKNRLGFDE